MVWQIIPLAGYLLLESCVSNCLEEVRFRYVCNSNPSEQTTLNQILRPTIPHLLSDWPLSSRSQVRNNLRYLIVTHHCKLLFSHGNVFVTLASRLPVRECAVQSQTVSLSRITSIPRWTFAWQAQVILPTGSAAFPSTALHSGQHLLQVLYLQLPHPSVNTASLERSAIFTAWMTGSGEMAWMAPITMTYLPVKTAAGGQLFSDNRFK